MIQRALRFAAWCLTGRENGPDGEVALRAITPSGRIAAIGTSSPRNWPQQNESTELISERHISAVCSVARPATRTVVRAFASGTTVQVYLIRKALSKAG